MVNVNNLSLGLMVSGDVFPFSWAISKDQNPHSLSGDFYLPLRRKKIPLKGSKNSVLIDVTNVQPALCGFRIKQKLFCKNFFNVNFFRKMSTFSGKTLQRNCVNTSVVNTFSPCRNRDRPHCAHRVEDGQDSHAYVGEYCHPHCG